MRLRGDKQRAIRPLGKHDFMEHGKKYRLKNSRMSILCIAVIAAALL